MVGDVPSVRWWLRTLRRHVVARGREKRCKVTRLAKPEYGNFAVRPPRGESRRFDEEVGDGSIVERDDTIDHARVAEQRRGWRIAHELDGCGRMG